MIVGGLDSMNARLNLNAQCIRFRKPLVDGGVSGYHGHVYTIFPYKNACYECNPLPVGESDEMAACTVVGIPRKRIHCIVFLKEIWHLKRNLTEIQIQKT